MADSQQGESGMAADLARQGASRLDAAASWLEGRQPGEILDEVRSFARRRPGAFIAGAAILGLVGGRVTRRAHGRLVRQRAASPRPSGAVSSGTTYGATRHTAPDTAYVAEPVDLEHRPDSVDAGIDPAPYTHPGSSTGVSGESR